MNSHLIHPPNRVCESQWAHLYWMCLFDFFFLREVNFNRWSTEKKCSSFAADFQQNRELIFTWFSFAQPSPEALSFFFFLFFSGRVKCYSFCWICSVPLLVSNLMQQFRHKWNIKPTLFFFLTGILWGVKLSLLLSLLKFQISCRLLIFI